MSRARVPTLGVVIGVLACACTSAGAPLDLEIPESDSPELDSEALADEELPPDEPEPEPLAELPTERCTTRSTPAEAVEVSDAADPRGGRLLTELRNGRVLELPLQHTSFDSIVVGTVAETTVTQRFGNDQAEPIEVVYTFPLPARRRGGRLLAPRGHPAASRGEIHRREGGPTRSTRRPSAKGQSAGLLDPGAPQRLHPARGQHRARRGHRGQHARGPAAAPRRRAATSWCCPRWSGPASSPAPPPGPAAAPGMVRRHGRGARRLAHHPARCCPPGFRSCGDLEIEVSIDAGSPIAQVATNSHRIEVEPDHLGAMVHLDERYALLNRDFVLSWRREGDEPTATVQAQPDADGRGGYFTLTVQPPASIDPGDVPGRELVFVVDASGSMSGAPMDMAKATMRRFIEGLGPDDAFQVIRFSESASGLGPVLRERTPQGVREALEYVDALEGQGGTAMTEGIKAALGMPRRGDRQRYVVFLTDGYIGNESEIFELIAEHIGDARLFSLGVGSSVNRHLLAGMARMGRGSVTYVDLDQPTAPVVDRIYQKLRQPALIDLEVDIQGLRVTDLVPERLPDLFVGEPVVLFGRYEGKLRGAMEVRGRRGSHDVTLPVALHEVRDEDTEGVRSMWARERIDQLELDPTLAWASQARLDTTKAEVIELSLAHRVLTQHTAFVAVDHTRTIQGHRNGKTVVQGVELPSGVAYEAVWGQVGPPPGSGDDGVGGLGLVGTGRGGGGTGEGSIGLGNVGVIGKGGGSGRGRAYDTVEPGGVGLDGRSRVRSARAKISGAISRDIIRRVVRSHHSEVRRCYNRGLVADPGLAGRVVIEFVIDAKGEVSMAVATKTTLADPEVGECIARAAEGWRFPKARDGGIARVTYPFVLWSR